ncbi:hypothetical protein [Streptomyces sp. GbtcB6]|uniref:hypothetical protein n=1 Tax=Streptomyces sp. GbtcB6 TaxID=2824751 RepID=UPI001C2FAD61|nr:hypothetical protein [Streptomyces sp. GbtcB6]
MLDEAVLPGHPIVGEPCPGCRVRLPWQAVGLHVPLLNKPTVQEAYDAAVAGDPAGLLKHLDPGKYDTEHNEVESEDGSRHPCRFSAYPSWLLTHCRTAKDVDDWVDRLRKLKEELKLDALWLPSA